MQRLIRYRKIKDWSAKFIYINMCKYGIYICTKTNMHIYKYTNLYMNMHI
jgi:hypothetical protein